MAELGGLGILVPDHHELTRRELSFDGIHFGPRITCPIIVNIGLQDNVCPPETGYAAFRTIASEDKKLYPYDGHGHDAGSVMHSAIFKEFFEEHLKS